LEEKYAKKVVTMEIEKKYAGKITQFCMPERNIKEIIQSKGKMIL